MPKTYVNILLHKKSKGRGSDIITDRKGMKCNNFTFCSMNKKYCIIHSKSHELEELENKNIDMRAFKIRIYPDLKQKQNIEKMFWLCKKNL